MTGPINGVFAWSSGELATFQAWDEANQHNTAPEESCVHIQGAHHEERYRGKWNDLAENGGWLGGLPGLVEVHENPDTDADGLLDRHEARYGAIVGERDTDGDGLSDGEEVHFFPSWDVAWEMGWEEALGAGHKMPGPAIWSTAGELLGFYPRLVEGMPPHLNPNLADTDGDGLLDGVECGRGPDGERIVDPYTQLTHPLDPDTDGDGLPDGVEDRNGNGRHDLPDETSAVNPDSDGDGLSDGLERGSAAFDRDPLTVTDPNRADSDGGGLPDQAEDFNGDGAIQLGETDPNDPSDDRLRVHLQRDPTTGGVTLGVHGLRRGAWVRVYLAEPAADPEAPLHFRQSAGAGQRRGARAQRHAAGNLAGPGPPRRAAPAHPAPRQPGRAAAAGGRDLPERLDPQLAGDRHAAALSSTGLRRPRAGIRQGL